MVLGAGGPATDEHDLSVDADEPGVRTAPGQPFWSWSAHDDSGRGGDIGFHATGRSHAHGAPYFDRRPGRAGVDQVVAHLPFLGPASSRHPRGGQTAFTDSDCLPGPGSRVNIGAVGDPDGPTVLGGLTGHGNVASEADQDTAAANDGGSLGRLVGAQCFRRSAQVQAHGERDPRL